MAEIEQGVIVEGITADHVWYNAKLLTNKMACWGYDFQKLVGIMEARHKEHLKMIADLLQERDVLRHRLSKLQTPAQELNHG